MFPAYSDFLSEINE